MSPSEGGCVLAQLPGGGEQPGVEVGGQAVHHQHGVAANLGHAEEDVEQPPALAVSLGRNTDFIYFMFKVFIYLLSDKFLGGHDQGVHTVDSDQSHGALPSKGNRSEQDSLEVVTHLTQWR